MQVRRAEVVRAASPEFVVDAAGNTRRYTTWSGRRLDDGYYLALWPRRCASDQYDARVRYFGPCASATEARFLALSARALGLLDPVSSRRRSAALPKSAGIAVFGAA
jgi:hypothetical protein